MAHRGLPMSRRVLLGWLAGATAAVALAACGGPSATVAMTAVTSGAQTAPVSSGSAVASAAASSSAKASSAAAAGGAIHLNYWCDIGDAYVQLAGQWAKDYGAANPGVTVDYVHVAAQYGDKLSAAFAGGTPPDVFRYLQEGTPIDAAVQRNLLLDLTSYVQRDKYDLTAFLPRSITLYQWKGKLYALPRDYGAQFVYYNADLFQKAGLTPPPWPWDDKTWTYSAYLEAAQKLTQLSGDNSQWGVVVNTGWRPWASFVYSNGGSVVKVGANGEATSMALGSTEAAEGLQFMQDLMFKYHVAPRTSQERQGKSPTELFEAGKVAMWITNPGAVKTFRTIKGFTWDVAALPIGDHAAKRGTGGGGTGWAAASPTKQPDAAWKFVTYISSEKAEFDEVAIGGTTPSRIAVTNSPQFLDPSQPPAHAKTFPDGQKYVVEDPVNLNWPQIQQDYLGKPLDPLWAGTKSAHDVIASIVPLADPLFQQGLSK